MSDGNKIVPIRPDAPAPDKMLVMMTATELRELVRAEVRAALGTGQNAIEPTELLRVSEAALRLKQSKDWVYRHWKEVGGKKLGPKSIRFSVVDIEKFIAKRGA